MFSFEHPGQGFEDNLRRAVKAEFDRAIAEVGETGFEVHGTVRNVRRRLKRVRAALKLIRPVFQNYRAESGALRNIGAEVAELRDAQALVEAVDFLSARLGGGPLPALGWLRRSFAERAAAREAAIDREALLLGLRQKLRDARVRAELWELRDAGPRALVPGFAGTYRRAREAGRVAQERRMPEHLHEWRKRVKDHWVQQSLLRPLAPSFAVARLDATRRLARTLGDYQNLSLLLGALRDSSLDAEAEDRALCLAAVEAAQRRLGKRALKRGVPLFAEKPGAVERRWRLYWDDWQAARRLG